MGGVTGGKSLRNNHRPAPMALGAGRIGEEPA